MEQDITAYRIANSIMQEGKFEGGVYLLVEGVKDIKVYGRLTNEKTARIKQTYGKYKQRRVYDILTERGFDSKLCIRDADFLRVPGNDKFIENFNKNIFVTDGHDSEIMIISSDALNNLLLITSSSEKIKAFEEKYKCNIREFILELAKPIGYLRFANKKYNLGLSFKPERPEGKKIKYKKFICDKEFKYIGIETMINIIYEYSKNRGQEVASRNFIMEKYLEVMKIDIPIIELANGHDVSEIISIIISKGLKSDSLLVSDQETTESSLALAYELRHFQDSNLFINIQNWSAKNGISIIKS
ncbi:MAG TPA: hypothetical protein DD649_03525 [Providencia sp.]|uniref:DUF4435 domain-containing protein n=1 Tax=Providencia sp. TaxID=589 RepID=UPI000E92EB59|nr:DUF4435 domain-containing protein [Providencia sp.]HBO21945.1 hypothetical protein [Providencia sp.]